MSEYRGAPPPAGPGKPVFNVIAPRVGEPPYDLTILDGQILGTECHWVTDERGENGRSRLCSYHQGDCRWCDKARKLWLGWLAVIDNLARSRAILRLGRDSAIELVKRSDRFAGLRGLRLKVSRSRNKATASLLYEDSPLAAGMPLADPHGLDTTICLVLGCDSLPDYRFSAAELRKGT